MVNMQMNTCSPGKYSHYALLLLLSVNLLNYIDRQILYAVFPLIKDDFALTDTSLGFLGSAFMLCYMVSAPIFGWIGDHTSRVKLASAGLVVWSAATSLAGFASRYYTLFLARLSVGIGEASFSTVSPGLLADYFPKERRGRVLSCFYLAIPVGSAFGYLLGGILGQKFGWQSAFFIVGIPGVLLAIPVWFLFEPQRGGGEKDAGESIQPTQAGFRSLFSNRPYIANTLAMTAMTFAMGGLAQWLPTFLYRVHKLDLVSANTFFGIITVFAGISGTLIGGWLGDYFEKKTNKGYVLVSGWGLLLGVPLSVYAILTPVLINCLAAIFFAEFFLFLNTGPLNTVIVNVTHPGIRARAFALNIFVIHALGDAVSPTVLGWLSDLWGLRYSLLVTPAVIALASFFCFLCGHFIEKENIHM